MDVSVEELEDAINFVEYDEASSVKNQVQNMGLKDKLKIYIKEYFPLISLVKSKLETSLTKGEKGSVSDQQSENNSVIGLRKAIELMRSQYDGEIIFIYHSQMSIMADGSLNFVEDKSFEEFNKACKDNNVRVIDMRPVFVECYEKEAKLPYGFTNTKPGNGHLNALGHSLIAKTVIPYIEEAMV